MTIFKYLGTEITYPNALMKTCTTDFKENEGYIIVEILKDRMYD